ncbi:hypothetical protein FRB99_008633 [Tulasnella sp. 403]|nr:hypothetical protein FRB99_008633 [Tulasnella sp. 403]
MRMQNRVNYTEAVVANGPRHTEQWTATVMINYPFTGTYIGQGWTKQSAREEASMLALHALGVDVYALA